MPSPKPQPRQTPPAKPAPIAKPAIAKSAAKPKVRKDDEEAEKSSSMRPDEMPADVLEFITAMDHYKRVHQRPFPNWSEVLEVVKGLGYVRARAS
jgi:hypothetical protein